MFKSANIRSIVAGLSLLSLAGIAGLAAPASAAASKTDDQILMKVKQRHGRTLYCYDQNITGSRLPEHSCFTKSEWAHRGAIVHDDEKRDAAVEKKSDAKS